MLQGKHKANYQRNQAMSDNIVVVNTSHVFESYIFYYLLKD